MLQRRQFSPLGMKVKKSVSPCSAVRESRVIGRFRSSSGAPPLPGAFRREAHLARAGVNVGTIGHVDHGRTKAKAGARWQAVTFMLPLRRWGEDCVQP